MLLGLYGTDFNLGVSVRATNTRSSRTFKLKGVATEGICRKLPSNTLGSCIVIIISPSMIKVKEQYNVLFTKESGIAAANVGLKHDSQAEIRRGRQTSYKPTFLILKSCSLQTQTTVLYLILNGKEVYLILIVFVCIFFLLQQLI